ncbi:Phage integrase family protein [Cohaesibacter sp. ES.047]|uniref:tyrosine-type recombinase/integrase n=1 Tax=Cohaesibacter sp. ES.047 TaxID=1798205 RepID=UPI000BC02CC8|nr:tyrosine-type recombinase/integrase [Cohaesibacter sp. ES.047]SNY94111.1 Phage integrase family protein [Cohaesibacter sp. ES.047]
MVKADLTGIHRYKKTLSGGLVRYYYKVSREKGAPVFWTRDHAPEPEPVSKAFIAAYHDKRADWFVNPIAESDTIAHLIRRVRITPEFQKLARATRAYYEEAFPHILEEFGEDEIAAFEDKAMRKDVKDWRNNWRATPRQADKMLGSLIYILNFAIDEGEITQHVISKIKRLHKSDRSYIIWEKEDIEAFKSDAPNHLKWVIDLATMTGLRREDLVTIPANADKDSHLEWRTHKSGRRLTIIVPIIGELRTLLNDIADHKGRQKIKSTTLLCNSRGKPWTGMGLSASFRKQASKHGIEKTMHDMRGTAVTHFKLAGLEDDEIADIVGWKKADVEKIIKLYIDKETVLRAIIHRVEKERQTNKNCKPAVNRRISIIKDE